MQINWSIEYQRSEHGQVSAFMAEKLLLALSLLYCRVWLKKARCSRGMLLQNVWLSHPLIFYPRIRPDDNTVIL